MKKLDVKFDFDDIVLQPATFTNIKSRSEVDPYYCNVNGFLDNVIKLPLITSPMDTVVGLNNIHIFNKNNIVVALPRTIPYDEILKSFDKRYFSELFMNTFISFGLEEFRNYFLDQTVKIVPEYVLIDIANGHMDILLDYSRKAKELYPNMKLMIGNIANPETYLKYAEEGNVDYIRIGVGNGSGCCLAGTKITTKDGVKNIEDINVGDYVLTHKNTYEEVIDTFSKKSNKLITINDKISVTPDHEFYVLNKKYLNIVNDENIHDYCEWIMAENLTNEYLLLESVDDV